MKVKSIIFVLIGLSLSFKALIKDPYISFFMVKGKNVEIAFNGGKPEKFRIYKQKYSFFNFENKKVYLETDSNAVFSQNLIQYIGSRFKDPDINPGTLPILEIILIIDSSGVIIAKGVGRETFEEYYNLHTIEILNSIDEKFTPAMADGKPVASIYKQKINFFDPEFTQYLK